VISQDRKELCCSQARRQDFAAGGKKQQVGSHFLNTILDYAATEAKHKMGRHRF